MEPHWLIGVTSIDSKASGRTCAEGKNQLLTDLKSLELKYSGGSYFEHSNTEHIWIPNILKLGIQMVP